MKEMELKKKEFIEQKPVVPIVNAPGKTFPLRMSAEFHAELVRAARKDGESLNSFVMLAIQDRMNR